MSTLCVTGFCGCNVATDCPTPGSTCDEFNFCVIPKADGGVPPADGGVPPPVDGGVVADGGQPPPGDAIVGGDSGLPPSGDGGINPAVDGGGSNTDSGGGCAIGPAASSPPMARLGWLLVIALALVAWQVRRRS